MGIIKSIFENLNTWGLPAIFLIVGIFEFALGLYKNKWTTNEKILDIVCYVGSKILFKPILAYFSLKLLPWAIPQFKDVFAWVPFWWGLLIIAVGDDLTQYWYHRLHHTVPWLWKFHRTHHSAPYMGMAMASRQNFLYTFMFPQIYVTITLSFLGLGVPALIVTGIKGIITTLAHSSIKWDKPLYENKWLHPLAWIVERTISTPATHHAHHAAHERDGIGNPYGNFGNMLFLWDVIFGTAKITRQYPEQYGVEDYHEEEWYVQALYPIFKSKKKESELAE